MRSGLNKMMQKKLKKL